MKKPRTSTVIIIAQFCTLIVCAAFCGWLFYQNWFLKQNAKMLASELGFHRARADFERGYQWLYEIKLFKINTVGMALNDDSSQATGRNDGPYEIRSLLTCDEYPAVCTEIRKVLVEAYNQHTHQLYEKPELFDSKGFHVAHPRTNSATALPIK